MSERRFNPLTGQWLLLSTGRLSRPWQGASDATPATQLPRHDPACYLCPGNTRASGAVNPAGVGCHVFDNDFPALQVDLPRTASTRDETPASALFRRAPTSGCCRVLVYDERHDLDMGTLPAASREAVVSTWCNQLDELSRRFAAVQLFENRGAQMGASSPHPHGQIWATEHVPHLHALEQNRQRAWLEANGEPLLAAYARAEADRGERTVLINSHWLVVVPWWATWPFETLLLPRRAVDSLLRLDAAERRALADILGALVRTFDALFGVAFPYSMGWHGAGWTPDAAQTVHAHFFPPLLRSASVRKFMVGYEMLAEAQRDMTPEAAAERLRASVSPG